LICCRLRFRHAAAIDACRYDAADFMMMLMLLMPLIRVTLIFAAAIDSHIGTTIRFSLRCR